MQQKVVRETQKEECCQEGQAQSGDPKLNPLPPFYLKLALHGVQCVSGYIEVPSCVCTHTYTKGGGGGQCPSFLTPQEVLLIPEKNSREA